MKFLVLLPLLLAGCAMQASGPLFSGPTKSEGATLILYRDNSYYGNFGKLPFEINGEKACELHNSSFYTQSGLHGKFTISASVWDMPGTSRLMINAKGNEIYYVRWNIDSSKQVASGFGGFFGQLAAEGAANTGGPYIFTIIEPSIAKQELKNLRQDCP